MTAGKVSRQKGASRLHRRFPFPGLLPSHDQRTDTDAHCPGESQFLTTPAVAKPLDFASLSLNDNDYEGGIPKGPKDSDARLMEMLAAQAAAHQAGHGAEDDDAIIDDQKMSEEEKKDALQKSLNMAASNGDVQKITKMLAGKAKTYVDVNAPDEDGTPPLIYASCFVRRI